MRVLLTLLIFALVGCQSAAPDPAESTALPSAEAEESTTRSEEDEKAVPTQNESNPVDEPDGPTPVATATGAPTVVEPTAVPTLMPTAQPPPTQRPNTPTPLPAPTHAAELEQADQVVGDGTNESCTAEALQKAVDKGGEIRFNCGGQTTIFIDQSIEISENTILDGNGIITLDGRQDRLLIKTTDRLTVTFRNLRFQNGWTGQQGGALQIGFWNNVTIEASTFINNRSTKNDAACDGGGAIFIGGGSVARIQNSHFEGNVANNGGAINSLRSQITVTGSSFINNHATHTDQINGFGDCGGGGGIYIDGTRKPEDGGPDPITLRDNDFFGNTTNNHGGAIFLAVRTGEKTTIANTVFEQNRVTFIPSMAQSGTGGAIWYGPGVGDVSGHTLTIQNSSFVGNFAEKQGGGLWLRAPTTIENSIFRENLVLNPADLGPDDWEKGIGGALAVEGEVRVVLENSRVTDNRAGFAGGGIMGQNVAAKNTVIANNATDWTKGLQQNCTHALVNWGGNAQYLAGHEKEDHALESNCGEDIPLEER